MKNKTSKELRKLIIWAKSEIDEYKDFILLCEKRIAKLKKKKNERRHINKN